MKVSEQIIDVIDALCEKLGVAIDWTSANVIPYIQQLCEKYIKYEVGTSVLCVGLWTLFLVGSIWYYKNKKKKLDEFLNSKDNSYDHNDMEDAFFESATGWLWVLGLMFLMIAIIGCIIAISTQSKDIITCLTFPEKAVYEFVSKNINSGG